MFLFKMLIKDSAFYLQTSLIFLRLELFMLLKRIHGSRLQKNKVQSEGEVVVGRLS